MIDEHLRCRNEMHALDDQLGKRAHQFRMIQKRLLVRLKDRNPAPLHNLELLLEGTQTQILTLASEMEAAQVRQSVERTPHLQRGMARSVCRIHRLMKGDHRLTKGGRVAQESSQLYRCTFCQKLFTSAQRECESCPKVRSRRYISAIHLANAIS